MNDPSNASGSSPVRPNRLDMISVSAFIMAALAGLATSLASANDDMRPGIIRADDRKPVPGAHRTWNGIGHINISGFRNNFACTGTLIAPGVVLTAAHCVIDPWSKKVFRPGRINFRAGVTNRKDVGRSVAKCIKLHDELEKRGTGIILRALPDRRMQVDNVQFDLAVIVLKRPIDDATPLAIAQPTADVGDLRVTHASYTADRRFSLMAHRDCRVKSRTKNLWVTDCDTHAAGSGGPIVLEGDNGNKLAAVMAGVVAKKATVAVPLDNWRELPLDTTCPAK